MITDEYVQLTDDQPSRKGWIWNTQVREETERKKNPPNISILRNLLLIFES